MARLQLWSWCAEILPNVTADDDWSSFSLTHIKSALHSFSVNTAPPPRWWISELHLTKGVITKSTFRAVCPERRWKTWICRKTLFTADPGRVTFVVFVKCPEQIFKQIKVLSFSIGFSSVFILFKPIITSQFIWHFLTCPPHQSSQFLLLPPPSCSSLLCSFLLFLALSSFSSSCLSLPLSVLLYLWFSFSHTASLTLDHTVPPPPPPPGQDVCCVLIRRAGFLQRNSAAQLQVSDQSTDKEHKCYGRHRSSFTQKKRRPWKAERTEINAQRRERWEEKSTQIKFSFF